MASRFQRTPEYQTHNSQFTGWNREMDSHTPSSFHFTAPFITVFLDSQTNTTPHHTTGPPPPLCSGVPQFLNTRKFLKNSPHRRKLPEDIRRKQRGPLDKVRRVLQLDSFAFATYLSSKKSLAVHGADRLIKS